MRLITQEYGMWADRVYAGGDVYQSYSSNQFSTSFTLTVVTCDFIAILKYTMYHRCLGMPPRKYTTLDTACGGIRNNILDIKLKLSRAPSHPPPHPHHHHQQCFVACIVNIIGSNNNLYNLEVIGSYKFNRLFGLYM